MPLGLIPHWVGLSEDRRERFWPGAPVRVSAPAIVWVLAVGKVSVAAPVTDLVKLLKVKLPEID